MKDDEEKGDEEVEDSAVNSSAEQIRKLKEELEETKGIVESQKRKMRLVIGRSEES